MKTTRNTRKYQASSVFRAAEAGSALLDPDGINEYLLSVLTPEQPGNYALPDLDMTATTRKDTEIVATFSWKGQRDTELFFMFTPENRDYPLRFFIREGGPMHLLEQINPDQLLADNFQKARLVSALLRVKSDTISAGDFDVAGNISGVVVSSVPPFTTLTYNNMISNKQGPGTVAKAIGIEQGLVQIHRPNGPHKFWTPHTANVTNIDELTTVTTKSGGDDPGWVVVDDDNLVPYDSGRPGAKRVSPDPGIGWFKFSGYVSRSVVADGEPGVGTPFIVDFTNSVDSTKLFGSGVARVQSELFTVDANLVTFNETGSYYFTFTSGAISVASECETWTIVNCGNGTTTFTDQRNFNPIEGEDQYGLISTISGRYDAVAGQQMALFGNMIGSSPVSFTTASTQLRIWALNGPEAGIGTFQVVVRQRQCDEEWNPIHVETVVFEAPTSGGRLVTDYFDSGRMYIPGVFDSVYIKTDVNSAFLSGSITVENYSFYSINALQPCGLLCAKGVNQGQSVTVTATLNYEVVPDSNLQKNVSATNKVEDPMEMEGAEYILSRLGENNLRLIYPTYMYDELVTSGHFQNLATTRAIYNAAPASFKSRLRDMLRHAGVNLAKLGLDHAGALAGGVASAVAGPEAGIVASRVAQGAANEYRRQNRYLAAPKSSKTAYY